jgi:hypothetical protein
MFGYLLISQVPQRLAEPLIEVQKDEKILKSPNIDEEQIVGSEEDTFSSSGSTLSNESRVSVIEVRNSLMNVLGTFGLNIIIALGVYLFIRNRYL